MKKLQKLPKEVLDILNDRLKDEYYAFYLYNAASNWCKNVGYFKASEFFATESADELTHAKKLEDFITLWNGTPNLPTISKPELEFEGLYEVICKAYETELKLYELYEDSSIKIMEIGDVCAFDFLQFFRNVQTESVGQYSDMINMLEGVDAKSKFEMLLLEKKLF
jgi:ferritin